MNYLSNEELARVCEADPDRIETWKEAARRFSKEVIETQDALNAAENECQEAYGELDEAVNLVAAFEQRIIDLQKNCPKDLLLGKVMVEIVDFFQDPAWGRFQELVYESENARNGRLPR